MTSTHRGTWRCTCSGSDVNGNAERRSLNSHHVPNAVGPTTARVHDDAPSGMHETTNCCCTGLCCLYRAGTHQHRVPGTSTYQHLALLQVHTFVRTAGKDSNSSVAKKKVRGIKKGFTRPKTKTGVRTQPVQVRPRTGTN